MDWEQDYIARYLAYRVRKYEQDSTQGIPYELAVTSVKTTRENLDKWLEAIREDSK